MPDTVEIAHWITIASFIVCGETGTYMVRRAEEPNALIQTHADETSWGEAEQHPTPDRRAEYVQHHRTDNLKHSHTDNLKHSHILMV